MFGPEYSTVAAYIPADSGTVLCRECGEEAKLPASDQITEAQMYESFGTDGAWCDACHAEIVAPFIDDRSEEN
jgi:hypothetical protein